MEDHDSTSSEDGSSKKYFYLNGEKFSSSELFYRDDAFVNQSDEDNESEEESTVDAQGTLTNLSSKLKNKISKYRSSSGRYAMEGKGRALLLNNYEFERKFVNKNIEGAYNNTCSIYKNLARIHWDVTIADNKTETELEEVLEAFCKEVKSKPTFGVMLFIGSHGLRVNGEDCFMTQDWKRHKLSSVVNKFTESNFPELAGKPKVFITEFCRDNVELKPLFKQQPEESRNVMISYATSSGCAAYSNGADGFWFVGTFCKMLKKYARKEHLAEILTKTNLLVALEGVNGRVEMSTNNTGLLKDFYLTK